MAEGTDPTIPVVRIYNTKVKDGEETGQAAVDRMNASEDHSVHCEAIMDIEVPAGFSYVDSDAKLTSLKDLKIDIRGRGNTTWLFEGKKKPYKIELDKKSPLYRYCQAAKGLKCTGKKKAVRVSWKKIKGASGYRILVSRNKNLEKAKVIKVKSKKTAYLVKSLESKKKYYIGLQPYKRSGGKTYLGAIKKKAVKTR